MTVKNFSIKEWCEEFNKSYKNAPGKELIEDAANLFITLTVNEKSLETDENTKSRMRESFIIKVIEKRLGVYHYTMSFAAVCALGFIFCNNLGENTMNMTYIEYLAKKHNIKHVDMQFIGLYAFPHGYVSEEIYNKMWETQKIKTDTRKIMMDNALDYREIINNI